MKPLRQRLFIFGFMVFLIMFGAGFVILQGYGIHGLFYNILLNESDDVRLKAAWVMATLGQLLILMSEFGTILGIMKIVGFICYGYNDKIIDSFGELVDKIYIHNWEEKQQKKKLSYWDKRYQEEDYEWRKKYDEVMRGME